MENDITIVKLTKKGKKYLVVTSGDNYTFDEDTIIEFGIFKDKVFSKQEFARIVNKGVANQAFNQALIYLGSSLKSIYEVRTYLEKKNYPAEVIETTVSRLIGLGYLNDLQYAKSLFNHYKTTKGPRFVESKLYEKHVSRNIIEDVLNEYSEAEEANDIRNLIEKAAPKLTEYPLNKQRQLLVGKLIRNGFTANLVYQIVKEYELIDDSDNRLLLDLQKQQRLLARKNLTPQQRKQKLIQSLMSKGYEYQKISSLLE